LRGRLSRAKNFVVRQHVRGHGCQNQDHGGPDAPILMDWAAFLDVPVLSIVRLIHKGLDSWLETVCLSLTHPRGVRVEFFARRIVRIGPADPFDNFAPVSYDNASNRSGRNLSLT
jgi:hypothetical protein